MKLRAFVVEVVCALVLMAIGMCIGVVLDPFMNGNAEDPAEEEETERVEVEIPPIEESIVWMLNEDGSWTCIPGGPEAKSMKVCDGAVP